MSFEQILERAEALLTTVKETKSMAVEVGELHMELWDNRDLSMRDYVREPIPFYPAIESMSAGLEDLIILMLRSGEKQDDAETLRQLFNYTTALSEPHRRVSMYDDHMVVVGFAGNEKSHTTYLDSSSMITDPITSFNNYAIVSDINF